MFIQFPFFFFLGAMMYLFPKVAVSIIGCYLAIALWVNRDLL